MTRKQPPYNLWFQSRACAKCRRCDARVANGAEPMILGEYVNGKWRHGVDFCNRCVDSALLILMSYSLREIREDRGIAFQARSGYSLPKWLSDWWADHLGPPPERIGEVSGRAALVGDIGVKQYSLFDEPMRWR